jgi:hypothetical protein
MSFSPSSPVTGGAQTGLTSPTYTLSADIAPAAHGKQYAVTALGGTQTGVEVHSISNPFTITMFKVASPKASPAANPSTGVIYNNPRNSTKVIVRKGVDIASGQAKQVAVFTLNMDIPAGADVADAESVRAALSLLFGTLSASSAAIGDVPIQNVL